MYRERSDGMWKYPWNSQETERYPFQIRTRHKNYETIKEQADRTPTKLTMHNRDPEENPELEETLSIGLGSNSLQGYLQAL